MSHRPAPVGSASQVRSAPARHRAARTAWPVLPPTDRDRWPGGKAAFTIGLCLPMRGAAGIWGPSCLAAARLAEAELNRRHGIDRRPCELLLVDASAESPDVERSLRELVDHGEVDALVGMCISSVRHRIVGAVGGRVPFVYPCLYEGGETTPEVYAIGETSARQLQPSLAWLAGRGLARRWMLVGHDYIWPRVSHRIARERIAGLGGEVVAEAVMPWGCDDYDAVFDQLRKSRADALLISMVGQEAVNFNRAFGRAGLSRQVLRLSCAIEENQLLAIGAANTENLHVALGYFASLETDANLAFRQRYQARFGERAPTLNAIGQSLYEGMHFLATMLHPDTASASTPLAYQSARGAMLLPTGETEAPIYLARAEGHDFKVLARF